MGKGSLESRFNLSALRPLTFYLHTSEATYVKTKLHGNVKSKKALVKGPLCYLVAGAGFEPTTSGL